MEVPIDRSRLRHGSPQGEEVMAPTGTRFLVSGEALYAVKAKTSMPVDEPSSGLFVLFAITDIKREWLGWYSFNTDFASDMVLLGSTHELVGEGTHHPMHFMTRKPIAVDGLLGGAPGNMRRAALAAHNFGFGPKVITLDLAISEASGPQNQIDLRSGLPTTRPLHLFINRKQPGGPERPLFGWVNFEMAEPFRSKSSHLNVARRRHQLERGQLNRSP
jgi:hypothetical protein